MYYTADDRKLSRSDSPSDADVPLIALPGCCVNDYHERKRSDREAGEASRTRGTEGRKGKGKGPPIDVRNARRVIYIDANKGSITT